MKTFKQSIFLLLIVWTVGAFLQAPQFGIRTSDAREEEQKKIGGEMMNNTSSVYKSSVDLRMAKKSSIKPQIVEKLSIYCTT